MTYIVERFKGKKLIVGAHIMKFKPSCNLVRHILDCEKEWMRIGYCDENI
jgi:hypothetical protein